MSFCRKCGTDIKDANFCPACGEPANPPAAPAAAPAPAATGYTGGYSEYYPELKLYSSRALQIFVFGILSLICCMGIGLIFEIICIVISSKMKTAFPHGDKLTNPVEIAMYNTAKQRHKIGAILASIALIVTGVLLFVIFMLGMIAIQT